MIKHYITFEDENNQEIMDYECSCAGERYFMMYAWNSGVRLSSFPQDAAYAFGWDYEPAEIITPMMERLIENNQWNHRNPATGHFTGGNRARTSGV